MIHQTRKFGALLLVPSLFDEALVICCFASCAQCLLMKYDKCGALLHCAHFVMKYNKFGALLLVPTLVDEM